MKKLLFVLSAVLAAFTSQAAYLFWQVGDLGDVTADSGSLVAKDGSGVEYHLTSYYLAENPDTGESVWTEVSSDVNTANSATQFAADLGDNIGEGYTYYVEMKNGSTPVAWSDSIAYSEDSGSEFVKYTDNATSTASLSPAATANIWHSSGSAGYSPVPEPTSAILMLFGAAMLGLKRKNRSRA